MNGRDHYHILKKTPNTIFQNFYSTHMFSEWAGYKNTFEKIVGETFGDSIDEFIEMHPIEDALKIFRLLAIYHCRNPKHKFPLA